MTCSARTLISYLFLLTLPFLNISVCLGSSIDSLRTEKIKGRLFVIHQVDQGETLYALSRRYKVSVPDIIAHNPSAKLDLAIGKIIQIPLPEPSAPIDTTGMIRHEVKPKETLYSISRQYNIDIAGLKASNKLTTNELSIGQTLYIKSDNSRAAPEPAKVDTSGDIMHSLQQGETLYSLSRKYNVSIGQLKTWNNINENNLSVGQSLIVGKHKNQMLPTKNPPIRARDTTIDNTTSKHINPDVTSQRDTSQTLTRVKNINGYDEIVESGIGEMIPGSTESRKYLGLHHTAKVGTIMKVRNEMNNKMVFVRVIGRIPDTGDNSKVLLKISKAAYDRLGIIDQRFRIEISYMP